MEKHRHGQFVMWFKILLLCQVVLQICYIDDQVYVSILVLCQVVFPRPVKNELLVNREIWMHETICQMTRCIGVYNSRASSACFPETC